MANRNLKGDVNVQFEEPTSRINLDSGSSVKTLFGRISKWLKDLKAVAFSGSYTDLSDKPTIPPATAVKGNSETNYRTGNVNLTPANIGLGNVNNTSDANKPISTATKAALDKQQAQVNAALKQTGYNLVEITSDTQTIYGVTFTVDKAAGTITANGTAIATLWFTLYAASLSADRYTLSGCPSNGSLNTYSLALYEDIPGAAPTIAYDVGEGNTFSVGAKRVRLEIRIIRGTTLSNAIFKPMIVPAELTGVPFQPYAKSNAELTSGKLDVTGMTYYKSYPEQFIARAQKGSLYYQLELHTIMAGGANLSDSSGGGIGLILGTPMLQNRGGDRLMFNTDGCISGQPANSYSRIGLRNSSGGTYIGFFMGVPGVYDSDDIPMCTFTAGGIKMDNALISGRSGTPTLTTNTGTVYEFKDDGIYLNGTRIAP